MKKIYLKIVSVSLLTFFTSCSAGWLDVTPSDAGTIEETIKDVASAKVALVGVYDALQGNSTYSEYYGARMIYYGDVRGDDMQGTLGGSRAKLSYESDFDAGTSVKIWSEPYRVIRRSNMLMRAFDNGLVTDGTDAERNDIKGQLLALRALAHFDLLRVYSQAFDVSATGNNYGIPLVLTVPKASDTPGRSSINETYAQIEADLSSAISLMSGEKNTGYFNLWAAKALLARVYLYKGTAADNQKAFDLAKDIIANSPYKLWSNAEYTTAWAKDGTSEVLFEIVTASTDDWVDRESIGYLYSEGGYADAVMTKKYVTFVETKYAGDVRLNLMKVATKDKENIWEGKGVFIAKYPGREGTNDVRVNNVPILRLSEVYLIAAEAAFKLNDKPNAVKYLNDIVLRGNPTATGETQASITLDRILDENRIEFVGEGHRFFDLIRNKKRVTRYTAESDRGWHLPLKVENRDFAHDYYRAILPIPDREITSNPIIAKQQNPGY